MKIRNWYFILFLTVIIVSCDDDDDDDPDPMLNIPTEYVSASYNANVTAENTVIGELSTMTSAANAAEADAQTTTVSAIPHPSTLSSVTLPSYQALIEGWLVELVNAANSPTSFQNPGAGMPADGEEGGKLGSRLLDENGLELEQMVQKGSFGSALYNHALTVINGDLSNSSAIDKLIEIHGADIAFDPSNTTAAATYSRRRSDLQAETGFFFDIKTNLITAKAAIDAGGFETERDQALADYLSNWEQSNFATVIYYCNAAKTQIQDASALADGEEKDAAFGNALHAYAEGVAFAHGFKGLPQKQITDTQIDSILDLLLAPEGQTPESYRFINEVTLLANFDQVIDDIQAIYGFSDAEVTGFFVNNNP
ncbi:MAG: hypothetical protein AAGA10_30550 [Bacteroidota bacterium]